MTKWEYKFLVMDLPIGDSHKSTKEEDDPLDINEGSLNEEGENGWEVVSVIPGMGAGKSYTFALMKRPRST